jgi:amino acid adenylation domain-containing protein
VSTRQRWIDFLARRDVDDIYPLSPMQAGMLFHSLYTPGGGEYVTQDCFRLGPNVDAEVMEQCWALVVNHHPALRSSAEWKGLERPLQLVHRRVCIPVEHRSPQREDPADGTAWLDAFLAEDRRRGINLTEAPLMRLTFLDGPDGERRLVWTHHHMLLDGWSLPLVIEELRGCYRSLVAGEQPPLPETPPFRDFIAWHSRRDAAADEAWWRRALHGFDEPTSLFAGSAPGVLSTTGAAQTEAFELPAPVTARLRETARSHRLTLNTVVQGTWGVLLSRYSGSSDVVFGITVSGRPADLPGVESMVGLFINTVPLRLQTPAGTSLIPWLRQLQADQAELRRHEHAPLADVQRWSQLPAGTPLFETLLVFENYPDRERTRAEGEDLVLQRSVDQTNFPLTLVVMPGEQLAVRLRYDGARFAPDAMRLLSGHMRLLLENIAARPEARLGELELLTDQERHRQLVEWNATEVPYPRDACVHELVARQVERSPEAVAVVCGDDRLTYRELDQKANRLAHRLRAAGAGPAKVVGICIERSPDMVVGLLAILKSGAAYVPLDIRHPQERLAFMLEESGATVLLTQRNLLASLPDHRAVTVLAEDETETVVQSSTPPANATSPEDIAYILYTSGSTGRPKGVRVRHRNVVNLMSALVKQPGLRQEDVVLAVATYTFDMAVGDIFPTLGIGARLVLASRDDVRDPRRLGAVIDASGATLMHATPTTWQMLLKSGWAGSQRLVAVCGGDTLSETLASSLLDRCAAVWNGYGPTETTVYTTFSQVTRDAPITIGRPTANVRVYILDRWRQPVAILDRWRQPVPVGVPGEIVVGGAGVSAGYVNRPDETAQRFVPDPFDPGASMYRTGDLGRFLRDGSIQHLGRLDRQVKIRGNRIELGEVEAALALHPGVTEAVVLAREDGESGGERRLAAYLVPSVHPGPGLAELRAHLVTRVPPYMLPSAFVMLDALPLTPSGKVDRRALPAPDAGRLTAQTAFAAPRTNVEERVAAIWARTLRVERVGIHDDFFEIGGHSLLAVRLLDEMEREFGVEIPLASFFHGDVTVASLAAVVESTADRPASGELMVADHTRGASPVIFFVYPNESSILSLRHFTKPLADHRIVGLHHTHDGRRFDRSRGVEDLILPMLEAIRRVQPSGPYRIAGYSFGGLLAYELASQLRACGDEVAWLGILDAAVPGFTRGRRQRRLPRLWHIARQRDHGPREALRLADDVIRREFRALLVRLHVRPMQTRDWDWRGARKLAQKYTCRPNDAPLDVFATEDTDPEKVTSLGWDTVHRGPLRVHHIPGNHKTMVQEPYASILAGELVRTLRTAPERAEGPPS